MLKRNSLILLCISLAFCATPAGAGDSTGITKNTIKIGLFGPMTGVAPAIQKQVYGSAAIYKNVNDHGGINGRKIAN